VAFLTAGTTSANCPGVGSAASGFLCVYESAGGLAPNNGHAVNTHSGFAGADVGGFMLAFNVPASTAGFDYGSWAVTG
jgi:hypothetical protein